MIQLCGHDRGCSLWCCSVVLCYFVVVPSTHFYDYFEAWHKKVNENGKNDFLVVVLA